MAANEANGDAPPLAVEVTTISGGLTIGSQVLGTGRTLLMPRASAELSAEQQAAKFGRPMWKLGGGGLPWPDEPARLLDVHDVARILGVSESHVRRMVSKRLLRAVKVGDGPRAPLRIPAKALEYWLGGLGDRSWRSLYPDQTVMPPSTYVDLRPEVDVSEAKGEPA